MKSFPFFLSIACGSASIPLRNFALRYPTTYFL